METVSLALALAAGVGLGLFYFGGLWLTVQRLRRVKRPALLLVASFALRRLLVAISFYVVMGNDVVKLAVCLAGFLLARGLLLRRFQPNKAAAR